MHARQRRGFVCVNAGDIGVGVRTAQEFAIEHTGEEQIIGVLCDPGDFAKTIDASRKWATDDVVRRGHTCLRRHARFRQLADAGRPARLLPGL